ncbi:glycosyl hydrolase family 28-related protein [Flavobacterium davisii]|uniref:glycosyl hydrolase family 28-related protein n=1 Tax=Flavobacterium davisii TaxID=2906077 RepID=UPI0035D09EE1
MKRGVFLKYVSLGAFAPLFFKKNESDFKFESDRVMPSYFKKAIKNDDGGEINDDFVDGVVYIKKYNNYYYNTLGRIDVKEFGAVGDGINDDTVFIQKAIDICVKSKKTLYISKPVKSYLCTSKIVISGQIYICGDGINVSGFNFVNSDGFEIKEGVLNVIIEKISINQSIRYSNRVNKFVAINVLGNREQRPYTHVYRDILIDGFNTAFLLDWIWDSHFDNIKILFGQIGFNIKGTSVNNNVCNVSISVEGKNSKGIFFSDGLNPTEGWRFSNLLTFGAEIGIHSIYTSNVFITTPILDFCKKIGVLLESSAGPSTNWQIIGGYIAMEGKSEAGIFLENNCDNNQNRGSRFIGLDIIAYPNTTAQFGIVFKGNYDKLDIIKGVTFNNFRKKIEYKNKSK